MITLADFARITLLGTAHPRLVQAATRSRPTDQRHNVHSNHKWRKQGAPSLAADRQPFRTTKSRPFNLGCPPSPTAHQYGGVIDKYFNQLVLLRNLLNRSQPGI
jgi:hypothetical protein